jgi:DNA-binding XRE family transcriptional regulator
MVKKIDSGFFEKDLKKRMKNRKFKAAYYNARLVREVSGQVEFMRRKKRLTQKQLADKAHIPQQEISKIEKGERNITLETLEKIASGLGKKVNVSFKV